MSRLSRTVTLTLTLAAAITLALPRTGSGQSAAAPLPSFAEPSLSPDGREIAFVSGGDIWSVPADGGVARLLVSHPAHESRPIFSPDGSRLAFVSTRTGNGDLYVVTLATGELRRLTHDDALDQLDGWSRDGEWVYFSSPSRDIAAMHDVWRVRATGGTPMQVAADRYTSEYWSAESPDGATVAITARGRVAQDWWRKGSSHIDESEIWLVRNVAVGRGGVPQYAALTGPGARHAWPMWSRDGATVYFVSDRGDHQNLWSMPVAGGAPRQHTRFEDGRVLWPTIAHDGSRIVFERDFGIWSYDVAGGQARAIPITLRGAPAATPTERLSLNNGFQELALAPDGRKLAFVVRGELFALASRDGGDPVRITQTVSSETHPQWAPDSRRLVYASDRDGTFQLYVHDFVSGREERLTEGAGDALAPRWSPDGRRIAYQRGGAELRVIDVASRRERTIARAVFPRPPFAGDRTMTWSPDGRWIAYTAPVGGRNFSNLFVVPADGGESRQVSWFSNVFSGPVSWSPDGTFLLVTTTQRTEDVDVARVDLVPRPPRFREDQFRDLFGPEVPQPRQPGPTPGAPPPATPPSATRDTARAASDSAAAPPRGRTELVFDDIRRRSSFLNTGLSASSAAISPNGRQLAIVASVAGQTNIYLWSLDELARPEPARQLTTTPGFKSAVQWSSDGREIYYLEQGRINAVNVENRTVRNISATAELTADFEEEKQAIFAQGWRWLRDNFYDERMHGVDWAAVRDRYAPRVAGARTREEMRRLMALMVGELNASHLGVFNPGSATTTATGRLGVRFDRAEYERSGRLRVSELLRFGPADLTGEISVGDVIVAVEGQPVGTGTNLDELLEHRIGRRTELTVQSAGGAARRVAVQPVNAQTAKGIHYRDWVESRRDYVARASGGRLGYVHMFDMGQNSLNQLHIDLDAEQHDREGVVIDIRNNNGGFVHAYALDVFTRRPFLTMQSRGFPQVPSRTQLGQRSLERPTVLVTNQHSLSDAEDFTEGYRAMGLGQVVGEPTSGWIIYTSNFQLLDGTTIRIPFQRIRDAQGRDMELEPRPVDVLVRRPVGEWYTGRDSQLDAAVRVLLGVVQAADGGR